ncbi:MAG: HAMP domain-containing protein [Spirochaetales bacterium]|nr:HAMP domain-containing protein [Spirochaetales bacterium]
MKLQTRIIFTVILISAVVNALSQFNSVRIQKKEAIENLYAKIQKTSDLLCGVNAGPLFYYDINLLEINLRYFLKDPEIKSIRIKEINGDIDLFLENNEISNNNLISVESDVLYNGEKIGIVNINFSQESILKQINRSIYNILLTIILNLLVISIFLILLINPIIKPVIELTDLAYKISNGSLNTEISISGKDEIRTLSMSFIKMRDSIKTQVETLRIENEERRKAEIALTAKTEELAKVNNELTVHKKHLQDIVTQRTSELQETIDRLEATKDKLVESEKMASLGDLVAGVAHEINTPVGIGVTAASHLENETKEFSKSVQLGNVSKSSLDKYIELVNESSSMILSNMLRAGNLIQSFKKVAVDQTSEEKREFKIMEYINEILLSIHSKFKHTNHKIDVICKEEFIIYSYPGALSQVVTNLCMNSLIHGFEYIDAGTITIELKKDEYTAEIIYSDNGKGMNQEQLKRIFDPFFTTKRGQGGSGLGMNIVYNLINQTLKGSIKCRSTLNRGTTFTIDIPVTV